LGWLLSEDDVVWSVAGRDNVAVIEERSASMEQEKWTGGFTVSSRGR